MRHVESFGGERKRPSTLVAPTARCPPHFAPLATSLWTIASPSRDLSPGAKALYLWAVASPDSRLTLFSLLSVQ